MALDLGLTTRQLLSALDDVALASRSHAQRLNYTLERGLNLSADAATRRPYPSAPTGPEGLLGSRPPPAIPTTDPVSPSRRRPPEQPRRWNGPPVVRQLPRRAGLPPCSVRATPP